MAFPTSCSLWKTTTLPPLSPVANSSPDELNSTVEIMSAATQEAEQRGGEKCQRGPAQSCQGISQTNRKNSETSGGVTCKRHVRGRMEGESRDKPAENSTVQIPQCGEIWVRRSHSVTHCMISTNSAPRLIEVSQSVSFNFTPVFLRTLPPPH